MAYLNSVPESGRSPAFGVLPLFFVLCALLLSPGNTGATPDGTGARLLTAEEGQAIVAAAAEHQRQMAGKPDCSHLVNEIYRLAGFSYAYASSFDLYSGGGHFARVRHAQPGDLIVWPGHVGVVVDPAEHSFYSSVRTGLETENYISPYWRGYGIPRFYRYRTGVSGSLTLAAARPAPRNAPERVQVLTVPVMEDEPDPPARGRAERATGESVGPRPRASEIPGAAETAASSLEVPSSIQLVSQHGKPTREEVAEAVSELSNATQNILRAAADPLQPRLPVVIFDQIRVERVQIKGERGWAEVRIESRAALGGGKMDRKRHHEKRRWELRHTATGWTAFTPLERIYMPRDAAVRILAEQLARLAAKENGSAPAPATLRQEAQLAAILNDLLKEK